MSVQRITAARLFLRPPFRDIFSNYKRILYLHDLGLRVVGTAFQRMNDVFTRNDAS